MTYAINRPCNYGGGMICANFAVKGSSKCEQHKTQAGRDLRATRGSTTQRGYGSDWERVQKRAMDRDNYICVLCKQRNPELVTIAVLVDHIIPVDKANPLADPNRLDMKNLQSLCESCHQRKTAREQGKGAA
jgi:5-methylcytosine-specific restriction protein A